MAEFASEFRSLQMSTTLLGWMLIVSSMAISAWLIFPPLLSRLRSSRRRLGQDLRGTAGPVTVAAAFLLVAGIGSVASYMEPLPGETGSGHAPASPLSHSGSLSHSGLDGEMLAGLEDYVGSTGSEDPARIEAAGKPLADVDTMIERLAARLNTGPEDIDGWRMLGWSYFNTGRYDKAASAYARAAELDPSSAELKLSYENAKAKVSEGENLQAAASLQSDAAGATNATNVEAMAPHQRDDEIRSMVDGLADRLERHPRDIGGWTRLMRSRVVLGEWEVAAAAFRKALDVFKDDAAASGEIVSAANALGLKSE